MAGLKIYEIAYQIENPKIKDFCPLRFAEVAASSVKEAKELFYRNHEYSKIIQIRIKRKENKK